MTTHTKDQLAEALRAVGLNQMADKAAEGYYHDYLSPEPFPELTLLNDLWQASEQQSVDEQRVAILKLRDRVKDGDFDASEEEGDDWADSPEGRETMEWLKHKSSRS